MRFYLGLIALFTLGLCLIAVGVACAATPIQIANAATPHSPCHGQLRIVPDEQPGIDGLAAGLADVGGFWALTSCDIAVSPSAWVRMDPEQRCELVVHEAVHYATLPGRSTSLPIHTADGLMAESAGYWPWCAPVDTRIIQRVVDLAPAGWDVTCLGRVGLVMRCTVERGRRVRSYRARLWAGAVTIDGWGYALRRIKTRGMG